VKWAQLVLLAKPEQRGQQAQLEEQQVQLAQWEQQAQQEAHKAIRELQEPQAHRELMA
jgi:hypothetical protein